MIENLRLAEKAKDGKKVVKRKAPEHNFANWDLQTLKRLMGAPPERLTSRFQVSIVARQFLVPDPEPRGDAGPKAFDQDVAFPGQPPGYGDPVLVLHVEAEAALAAIIDRRQRGVVP